MYFLGVSNCLCNLLEDIGLQNTCAVGRDQLRRAGSRVIHLISRVQGPVLLAVRADNAGVQIIYVHLEIVLNLLAYLIRKRDDHLEEQSRKELERVVDSYLYSHKSKYLHDQLV